MLFFLWLPYLEEAKKLFLKKNLKKSMTAKQISSEIEKKREKSF